MSIMRSCEKFERVGGRVSPECNVRSGPQVLARIDLFVGWYPIRVLNAGVSFEDMLRDGIAVYFDMGSG